MSFNKNIFIGLVISEFVFFFIPSATRATLYVANYGNDTVQAFDGLGNLQATSSPLPFSPFGLAADSSTGTLYVAGDSRIRKLSMSTLADMGGFTFSSSHQLRDIVLFNGFIYATNNSSPVKTVRKIDPGTGTDTLFATLTGPGQNALGLYWKPDGSILYVASRNDTTVYRFDSSGNPLSPDQGPTTNMNIPQFIFIDPATGNIDVSNSGSSSVSEYDSSESFLRSYTSGLSSPSGLAIDNGILYVADFSLNKILQYNLSSPYNLINANFITGLSSPEDILFGSAFAVPEPASALLLLLPLGALVLRRRQGGRPY